MGLEENRITGEILGAAIEVHRLLGPGLLESAYEECLAHELEMRALDFERQKPVPLRYTGVSLECSYRVDLLVTQVVVVEVKALDRILSIHSAQTLW